MGLMRKAFDILPPRSRSGAASLEIPPPRVERDLTTLEVQPHDWHVRTPTIAPSEAIPGPSFVRQLFLMFRQGTLYLFVGLLSFALFSALFYGYNQYQDRQRAALGEESGVAGTQDAESMPKPTIRTLNGSGSAAQLETLQDALETKGYEARATGTAAQPSERTLIYFRTDAEQMALKLAADIAQFAPALEKNDNVTGLDDIVILLGSLPNLGAL